MRPAYPRFPAVSMNGRWLPLSKTRCLLDRSRRATLRHYADLEVDEVVCVFGSPSGSEAIERLGGERDALGVAGT
jgi:hypothetical protein